MLLCASILLHFSGMFAIPYLKVPPNITVLDFLKAADHGEAVGAQVEDRREEEDDV